MRWTLGIAASVAALFATCYGLSALSFNIMMAMLSDNVCDENSPDNEIERYGQFRLPESATELDSFCFGGQGPVAMATFKMDPSDLDDFVAGTYIEPPLQSDGYPQERCGLWTGRRGATPHLHGLFQDGEFWQAIYVDMIDPDQYTVTICTIGG